MLNRMFEELDLSQLDDSTRHPDHHPRRTNNGSLNILWIELGDTNSNAIALESIGNGFTKHLDRFHLLLNAAERDLDLLIDRDGALQYGPCHHRSLSLERKAVIDCHQKLIRCEFLSLRGQER